ncbi:methyltransferase C9orf114 protein [Thalictrum thalictroides]|uniref:Methyltransferase C9orf114 protein n=1 Tax=Thalictrum thalictroides TaxID=46969 RepID=A0A7J6X8M0_THATH|nr:methyltransferase C9orf114 protein [Thalictrum thalictroides]
MAKKKRRSETEEAETIEAKEKKETDEKKLVNGEAEADKKKRKKDKQSKNSKNKEIPTVSIAVPGSIIHNAQSLELATRLAGQIARAATIFRIDEIVVFDNKSSNSDYSSLVTAEEADGDEMGAAFLIRILKYLETPQYLRKTLFPMHNSLRCVGTLPPLDAPHHLRKHEWGPYREGITLKEKSPDSTGTLVDVGLSKNVVIDETLEPGIRVTVAMGNDRHLEMGNYDFRNNILYLAPNVHKI